MRSPPIGGDYLIVCLMPGAPESPRGCCGVWTSRPDNTLAQRHRPTVFAVQLVQRSVVGLGNRVVEPRDAMTPDNAGMEKYVLSHAVGASIAMLAALRNVTVRGLPD